jgi:hypothetical protein
MSKAAKKKSKKKSKKQQFFFTEENEWKVRKEHGQVLVFVKGNNGPVLVAFDNRENAQKFLGDLDKHNVEWVVSPPDVVPIREEDIS